MKFKILIYKVIFCFFLNSLCFAETKSLYGKKLFSKDKTNKSISDKNSSKSLYGKKLFAKKKDRNTEKKTDTQTNKNTEKNTEKKKKIYIKKIK